ncbi:hypothetical protein [Clostridium fungisolvens]|uniref:Co-chaperone DjlA N-terminal domain-containing protein n=1 Tax=Clostridium fungisolvens TaxID=1604897 RepID=A0A6V8SMZ1_9CLOT|nr:hypothetical protein [Clostridium fungisolvens]GFP76253.1 hypothetical protein bsdtw1_02354 [Clostridium fungisolvens]
MFLSELIIKEKEAFMVVAKEIIESDDKIEKSEEDLLNSYKIEMNLIEDDIRDLKIEVNEAKHTLAGMTTDKKRKVYMELYALAFCDGDYDKKEKEIMDEIKAKFEISDDTQKELETCVNELNLVYKKISAVVNE